MKRNLFDELKEQKQKLDADRSGLWLRLELGQNWVYIVGNPKEKLTVSRDRHGTYTCPKKTNGTPCYACDSLVEAKKRGDKAFEEKWKTKVSGYFFVVPREVVKKARKEHTPLSSDDVRLLQVGSGVYNKIIQDMMTNRFDPSDPEEMRPLCITKRSVNTAFKVEYAVQFGEESDLTSVFTEDFVNSLPSLEEMPELNAASNAEIRLAVENNVDFYAKRTDAPKAKNNRQEDTSEFDDEGGGATRSGLKDAEETDDIPF